MQNDKRKCNNYEACFIFQDEEAFNYHIANCEDCRKEHEKYLKISALLKEAAPVYLNKLKKKRSNNYKKLACCFIAFLALVSFSGMKIYEENNFKVNSLYDSYISTMGLPTDDYGFLEI